MVNGNVVAIYISRIAGGKMEEVEIAEAIVGAGLAGDRYSRGDGSFNRNRQGSRQVTLINSIFFKDSGFEFVESRRNIVTQGVELMWLIGREFQIGKARSRSELLRSLSSALTPVWKKGKVFGSVQRSRWSCRRDHRRWHDQKGDLISLKELPQEAYYYRNRQDT
jgi:hypothetical protein